MVETVEITAVRKVFVDSRFWRFSRNSTGSSKCESNEQKKTRKNRDKHSKTVAMEQTPNRQR